MNEIKLISEKMFDSSSATTPALLWSWTIIFLIPSPRQWFTQTVNNVDTHVRMRMSVVQTLWTGINYWNKSGFVHLKTLASALVSENSFSFEQVSRGGCGVCVCVCIIIYINYWACDTGIYGSRVAPLLWLMEPPSVTSQPGNRTCKWSRLPSE